MAFSLSISGGLFPRPGMSFRITLGKFFEADSSYGVHSLRFGTREFSVTVPLWTLGQVRWMDRKAWRVWREPGRVTVFTGPAEWTMERVTLNGNRCSRPEQEAEDVS